MLIRRLVIAALLASAGVAQAATIPTTAAPSNFVSGWTTGNGTDVLGSGVLQGSLNLVGGVAHGTGSDARLTDVLYGKVAGTMGAIDGQTRLFFQRGIEASYLLASGHGILAATIGPGKSVVGSADGAIISNGMGKAPQLPPGLGGGATGGSGAVVGGGGLAAGGGASGGSFSGGSSGGSFAGGSGMTAGGSFGSGSQAGGSVGASQGASPLMPGGSGLSTAPAAANPGSTMAQERVSPAAVAIPEPSSVALMLAGLFGAGVLARRRSR